MNIKKINFLLVLLLLCGLSITGTHATSSSVTVENHLQTGDINIRIDEFQLNKYLHEEPYVQPELLMPGDMISKIPRITNLSEPCYIRTKISFPSTIDDVIPPVIESEDDIDMTGSIIYHLAEKDILGLSADWVKIQDYYYYRPLLEKEESAVLFQGVRIPEHWDNTYANADFFIDIQVEAIQAIHFTPDYTSDSPWGDVKPEVCIHNEPYEKPSAGFLSLFVEYDKESKELITTPDDFFSNFTNAMPGDILTDKIILKNTTKQTAEFFFHTEVPSTLSTEQLGILDEIVLSISMDEKTLYYGNLLSESLTSDISLGSYKSGESREFVFTLYIPTYWTNDRSLKDSSVKWIFSVMEEPTMKEHISLTPKTGDFSNIYIYLGVLLGSIGCVGTVGLIRYIRKGRSI